MIATAPTPDPTLIPMVCSRVRLMPAGLGTEDAVSAAMDVVNGSALVVDIRGV